MQVEMGNGWWVALLGWPALAAGVGAFWFAWVRKSRPAGIVGCVLTAPLFLYLSLTPRFQWLAPVALGLLCILAWRIRHAGGLTACLLALPAACIVLWLAFAVFVYR